MGSPPSMVEELVSQLLAAGHRQRDAADVSSESIASSTCNVEAAEGSRCEVTATDGVDPLDAYMAIVEAELLRPEKEAAHQAGSCQPPSAAITRSRSRSPSLAPAHARAQGAAVAANSVAT